MPSAQPTLRSQEEISLRLATLGLREEEFEEVFARSGGAGGQNVNKTSTCVQLLHRPSGLRVKCQSMRHQGQNRLRAWHLLLDKIVESRRKAAAMVEAAREKLRRQNRPRSRNAKARILAGKARQSTKKQFRKPPSME